MPPRVCLGTSWDRLRIVLMNGNHRPDFCSEGSHAAINLQCCTSENVKAVGKTRSTATVVHGSEVFLIKLTRFKAGSASLGSTERVRWLYSKPAVAPLPDSSSNLLPTFSLSTPCKPPPLTTAVQLHMISSLFDMDGTLVCLSFNQASHPLSQLTDKLDCGNRRPCP